jgi:uncharacterized protein (TIGR03790 family)
MSFLRSLLFFLIAGSQSFCSAATIHPKESDFLVVIYNRNDPAAKSLADFYCTQRGIDPACQIPVETPRKEEISRTEYDSLIAEPVRKEFLRRGLWSITRDMMNRPILFASSVHYAVLIKGMPLKICQTEFYPGDAKNQPDPYGGVNAASVDSELSVLGLFTPQISGTLKNPLYSPELAIPSDSSCIPVPMILVSRLDGPNDECVRMMISDSLKAEKEGLWGWGYIDLQSSTNEAYMRGDRWIREAGEAQRKHGIPVIVDDLPETFQPGFPVTDAAAYYGWHDESVDGPFADSTFRFISGAIAVHLHSLSAMTLHDSTKGWTGPLIQHGAAVSLGNVFEPYLPFTTDLGVFTRALLEGRNLVQSYYAAQPVLSWMSVCIGDPLYRPYAFFDKQTGQPENIWSDYRRIILSHNGNVLDAAPDLRKRSKERGESLYLEALGAAQLSAGEPKAAEESFHEARTYAQSQYASFRLFLEEVRSLEKSGNKTKALQLLRIEVMTCIEKDRKNLLQSWIQRLESRN